MQLRHLNARLTKHVRQLVDPTQFVDGVLSPSGYRDLYIDVDTLAEADGIWFDCPCDQCQSSDWPARIMIGFADRATTPGTYSRGSDGSDTRWTILGGTGLDDLQLAPSIQLHDTCRWHGFVGSNGVPPGEAR